MQFRQTMVYSKTTKKLLLDRKQKMKEEKKYYPFLYVAASKTASGSLKRQRNPLVRAISL
jgi:hypothetical protein